MDNLLAEIRQTNAEVKTELATAKIAMQMTQSDMKSILDDAIQGGLLNISNALSSMTTNTSMAIQQMEKETKIMKGKL
ncbi:hypothetical protein DPMN_032664 [Dreissena polymorpha]|uniref:Uncharacterized protein n=1 Tax=Dreissena polymorpha TaxID=45954 RepID=A0A9D4M2A8_DREPO|nr:hypothetical protein DPMN_032664 [Dreissena polymorpha]